MEVFSFWLEKTMAGMVIFTRIGAMLSITPFFSSSTLPFRMRFIFSLFLTLIMAPMVITTYTSIMPKNFFAYGLLVFEQAMIGIIIGFMISTVFSAFQLAGQYFSVQIGFGMNEVIDPLGQISIPVTGQFLNLISFLVFLAIGGAEATLRTLYLSFKILPVAMWQESSAIVLMGAVSKAFIGMFLIAFKIAIPIMGTIFVITTAMGLLGKVAPQMNIMMLAFPLKILIAFSILFILTPIMIALIGDATMRIFSFTDDMIWQWAKASGLAG